MGRAERAIRQQQQQQGRAGAPVNPIRRRNDMSAANPLDILADGAAEPEEAVEEWEGMSKTAVRMLLGGEIKNHEFVRFVSSTAETVFTGVEDAEEKIVKAEKEAEILVRRNEENGPFTFRRMIDEVKKILGK